MLEKILEKIPIVRDLHNWINYGSVMREIGSEFGKESADVQREVDEIVDTSGVKIGNYCGTTLILAKDASDNNYRNGMNRVNKFKDGELNYHYANFFRRNLYYEDINQECLTFSLDVEKKEDLMLYLDFVSQFPVGERKNISKALFIVKIGSKSEEVIRAINTVKQFKNVEDAAACYAELAAKTKNNWISSIADIMIKYKDYFDDLYKAASDLTPSLKYQQIEALMKNDTFRQVQKSNNPYRIFAGIISDQYMKIQRMTSIPLRCTDMEEILNTLVLVQEVHHDRKEYWGQIKDGFIRELNRSIYQGKDLKSMQDNVVLYCKEVQAMVKDNASELMYIGS